MFSVYLLKSEKDGKHYIGQTADIECRLQEHNNGLGKSTRNRTPFRLIGYETFATREEARWREHNLKKSAHQRKKFIDKFIIPG